MMAGRMGSLLAPLLAVVLYVLAFPPADLGLLAFVALAPWCFMARRFRGWNLFGMGTLTGAAILAFGCAWISATAPINLLFMVVPESLWFGGFALLLRALHVTRAWPAVVALPAAFTSVEFLRGHVPLDGFPWLTLGYSQHAWIEIVQISVLAGVTGVTFLLALVAGAIVDAARARGTRRWQWLALAGVVVAVTAIAGRFAIGDPASLRRGPRLLIVQPNLEQRLKMSGAASADEILRRHFAYGEETLRRETAPVDLAIWSETMVPAIWPVEGESDPSEASDIVESRRYVRDALSRYWFQPHQRPLLSGVMTLSGDRGDVDSVLFNSAILFDAQGRRLATYDKKVCVPGGEYLPWIDCLPDSMASSIRRSVLDLAGFLPNCMPGRRPGVIDLNQVGIPARAGMTICFEFAYPHVGRELVQQGADFIVNLSNEAWFPDTAEFDQATAMTVFRAAEVRRSVVRCANSGISGWIDPWGRAHRFESPQGARHGFGGALVITPLLAEGETPYVRWGEWLAVGCCGAAVLLLLRRRVVTVNDRAI